MWRRLVKATGDYISAGEHSTVRAGRMHNALMADGSWLVPEGSVLLQCKTLASERKTSCCIPSRARRT